MLIRDGLKLAQELLLFTDDPLGQIAVARGFVHQSHFTRVFPRDAGEPPAVWRRFNLTEAQVQTMKRAAA
jgi:AraC family transcriptional regulator